MSTSISKTTLFLLLAFFAAQSQTQTWQWAKQAGSMSDNSNPFSTGDQNERIRDVKVDKYGNVYAVGEFYGNPVFVNAATTWTYLSTSGGYGERDAYLIKYDKCGTTLWWRRMGGVNDDYATSLVLDNNGRVIIAGSCAATFTLGGSNIQNTILNGGGNFLARFDTSGNFIDIHSNSISLGVANLYKVFITSQGDYFVSSGLQAARINTLGVVTSTYSYANAAGYVPNISDIDLDKNDNVYLSGFFSFTTTIGSGVVITTTNVAQGAGNGLIMKFSPTGNLLWYKTSNPSGSYGDELRTCTIDTSGTKIIAGGRAQLGGIVFGYTVSSLSLPQYANIFFVFDANTGNLLSAVTGTIQNQAITSPIYTDRNNNIHCAGAIGGYLAFNTVTYVATPSTGVPQSCIGKIDVLASLINTITINMLPQAGSSVGGTEAINGMDIDEQGNIYIGGMFGGTLDSAGTAVVKYGGAEDGFIAKFGFPCGSTLTTLSPLPPTSLMAQYQATLTNYVTWIDNAQYETGFELWYNINGAANFSLLATLPANTTTYTHTGLSYNSNYCYKARAINNVGASLFTNIDCASTPTNNSTGTAPNAPLNLTAVNNGSLTNHVAWTDNSNDEDSFDLYFKIGAGSTANYSLLATLPANTTSYTHTGLSYTTTYCYKVAATNTAGSNYSNEACVSTPPLPTGIAEQNALDFYTEVFPNPTGGEVMLRFPPLGAETDIEVINSLGEVVQSIKQPANKNVFISSVLIQLPKEKGLYFIKVTAGTSRASVVKKVVVE